MEQFDIAEAPPTLLDDPSEESRDGGKGKAGEGPQARLIGYRWIAGRGKEACPKCAALHNKVFYKNPSRARPRLMTCPRGSCTPIVGVLLSR